MNRESLYESVLDEALIDLFISLNPEAPFYPETPEESMELDKAKQKIMPLLAKDT